MQAHGIPLGELEAEVSSSRRRILLVDDDEALLEILRSYLEELGLFELEVATNGYEAGLKTQAFRPHLLMLDHNLGDITGIEVAVSIRKNPELKDTKILVMSGFLSESDVRSVLEEGVDDFLHKPFGMEAARDKIFQLLKVA